MALLFTLGIISVLFIFLLPQFEKDGPQGMFYNEDVPLPKSLHPTVEKRKNQLVERVEKKGIKIVITEGHRTEERQDRLYEQGRSDNGNIVTYAKGGESYHNYGLAIDFAVENNDGAVIWDTKYDGNGNGRADWMEIVDVAKELGFDWGGDWENFKDYPHLQMDFGLSIRELKNGKRPEVNDYADEE
jgi:peptidoglycan L-alanyl-D-glutamate endopeptidase CwlK